MIDTPNNCHVQAAFCRAQAANASLANIRLRHLAAAGAWESLAAMLEGPGRASAARYRVARPDADLRDAIVAAKRARRNGGNPV